MKSNLFRRFADYMKRTAFNKAVALLLIALGYAGYVFIGDGTALIFFLIFFVPPLLITDEES